VTRRGLCHAGEALQARTDAADVAGIRGGFAPDLLDMADVAWHEQDRHVGECQACRAVFCAETAAL
jgi:hypothetical protein